MAHLAVQQGIAPVVWPDMLSSAETSPGSGLRRSLCGSGIQMRLSASPHAGECQPLDGHLLVDAGPHARTAR